MQSAILTKLEDELNQSIDSERQTLYILAEVRKYIEEYEKHNSAQYENLYFFCNWVLHVRMDLPRSQKYLQKLENNLGSLDKMNVKDIAKTFYRKNGSFYLFEDLRRELKLFINNHSLPSELVEKDSSWYKFIFHLVNILMDCALVNKKGLIEKFTFEKKDGIFNFRLRVRGFSGSVKVPLKVEMKLFHN